MVRHYAVRSDGTISLLDTKAAVHLPGRTLFVMTHGGCTSSAHSPNGIDTRRAVGSWCRRDWRRANAIGKRDREARHLSGRGRRPFRGPRVVQIPDAFTGPCRPVARRKRSFTSSPRRAGDAILVVRRELRERPVSAKSDT